MNCLEYRRLLGSDPRRESAEMQAHRRGCNGCSSHHAQALGFELALKRALNVAVPDGLAERILLVQTTAERGSNGRRRRQLRWLAVAAVLVAVVGLSVFQLRVFEPLPQQLIAHLGHEPESLLTHTALPAQEVEQRFAQRGVPLIGPLPEGISYAQPCPVGMLASVHMVMPEPEGPVTVFYLPGHETERGNFASGTMHVRAVPMAKGTLALVAADTRHFDALEARWRLTLEGRGDIAAGAL
ncbi:uncharacterized protein DUF3379 [Tahibacter aquaticus]|uniref:Uncharacterized protein DUF3379 n=1 Tax=Tahibacter aquaticus TaxID=520092 RepID=A0A4R6Z6S9_9GAMM|nr:DUF3379 family protein [Tahibacter aquaticus]TDR47442.1 uncharacterized protein DUF3379 [Tahibacter aquaticus]